MAWPSGSIITMMMGSVRTYGPGGYLSETTRRYVPEDFEVLVVYTTNVVLQRLQYILFYTPLFRVLKPCNLFKVDENYVKLCNKTRKFHRSKNCFSHDIILWCNLLINLIIITLRAR
jgi:hypothetical protein